MPSVSSAWALATRRKPVCRDDSEGRLRRCLRLRDVVAFGVGVTVGGGIFVATGQAVLEAGPAAVLSFLLAASGCGCTGLCYAEMSTLVPNAGGAYSFCYNAVGELPAFVVGIISISGNILSSAAVARGWASYLHLFFAEVGLPFPSAFAFFQFSGFSISLAAFVLVLLLTVVNLFGVEATATFNGVITCISVLMLTIFTVGASPSVDPGRWSPFMPHGVGGVFRGAGTVFFAYLGFDLLANLSEEAEDPKVVPRGIVMTLVASTFLYCATAVAFTGLVSIDEVTSAAPLASACKLRGLDTLAKCVAVGAVGSTMTSVVGGIVGGPRVCFVMAQDGLLPQSLIHVSQSGTPLAALLCTSVPTLLCALLFEFAELADVCSAGALCSFSLVCVSLIVRRFQSFLDIDYSPLDRPEIKSGNSWRVGAEMVGQPQVNEIELQTTDLDASPVNSEVVDSFEHPEQKRIERALHVALISYALLGFVTGLLLRVPGASLVALVFGPSTLAAATWIAVCFRRTAENLRSDGASEETEFLLPFMPLVPLLGILMNMLLLSQMPALALFRMLGVLVLCTGLYFGYAASRSRLGDGETGSQVGNCNGVMLS